MSISLLTTQETSSLFICQMASLTRLAVCVCVKMVLDGHCLCAGFLSLLLCLSPTCVLPLFLSLSLSVCVCGFPCGETPVPVTFCLCFFLCKDTVCVLVALCVSVCVCVCHTVVKLEIKYKVSPP